MEINLYIQDIRKKKTCLYIWGRGSVSHIGSLTKFKLTFQKLHR